MHAYVNADTLIGEALMIWGELEGHKSHKQHQKQSRIVRCHWNGIVPVLLRLRTQGFHSGWGSMVLTQGTVVAGRVAWATVRSFF